MGIKFLRFSTDKSLYISILYFRGWLLLLSLHSTVAVCSILWVESSRCCGPDTLSSAVHCVLWIVKRLLHWVSAAAISQSKLMAATCLLSVNTSPAGCQLSVCPLVINQSVQLTTSVSLCSFITYTWVHGLLYGAYNIGCLIIWLANCPRSFTE